MQDFTAILSNFGFPVAVASYLLFRFERILMGLQVTNTELVSKNLLLWSKNDELAKETRELKDEIIKLRNVIDTKLK